jgi:hypothetical protein
MQIKQGFETIIEGINGSTRPIRDDFYFSKELLIEYFQDKFTSFQEAVEGLESIDNEGILEKHRQRLGEILTFQLEHGASDKEMKKLLKSVRCLDELNTELISDQGAKAELKEDTERIREGIKTISPSRLLACTSVASVNYAIEMIASNAVEFGIDTALGVAMLTKDIPTATKILYGLIIGYSAQPFPLPSIAGVTRTVIHNKFSRPIYERLFRRDSYREIRIRNIDKITTLEWTGLTVLPILNILDALGLDVSIKTIQNIDRLQHILATEKTAEQRGF